MGIDIHGYIEVRHTQPHKWWEAIVNAGELVGNHEVRGEPILGVHPSKYYRSVELRVPRRQHWKAVLDVHNIMGLDRDYTFWGCLFGVKNTGNFKPIAANRGLPSTRSELVGKECRELGRYAAHRTWITLDEILAIDWEEPAEEVSEHVHVYEVRDDGSEELSWLYRLDSQNETLTQEEQETLGNKSHVFEQRRQTYRLVRKDGRRKVHAVYAKVVKGETQQYSETWYTMKDLKLLTDDEKKELRNNKELIKETTYVHRYVILQRKDTLTPRWEMLFDTMKRFGEHYGNENVRLVVWFDS